MAIQVFQINLSWDWEWQNRNPGIPDKPFAELGMKMDVIKKTGLNSNQIKLIAIIAMTIDHVTWLLIWTAMYAAVYFIFLDKVYGILQMFTLLSLPILKIYNGERGQWRGMKWLFYIYYPAHLFVIGIIREMMGKGSIFP